MRFDMTVIPETGMSAEQFVVGINGDHESGGRRILEPIGLATETGPNGSWEAAGTSTARQTPTLGVHGRCSV